MCATRTRRAACTRCATCHRGVPAMATCGTWWMTSCTSYRASCTSPLVRWTASPSSPPTRPWATCGPAHCSRRTCALSGRAHWSNSACYSCASPVPCGAPPVTAACLVTFCCSTLDSRMPRVPPWCWSACSSCLASALTSTWANAATITRHLCAPRRECVAQWSTWRTCCSTLPAWPGPSTRWSSESAKPSAASCWCQSRPPSSRLATPASPSTGTTLASS
mmetsp:Transcript_4966/g.16018  ORF Transcript_4966/g.16018 Transcript_4966/m.16018 type:complete len:221 (+) Transcript_4966:130-792(+)